MEQSLNIYCIGLLHQTASMDGFRLHNTRSICT